MIKFSSFNLVQAHIDQSDHLVHLELLSSLLLLQYFNEIQSKFLSSEEAVNQLHQFKYMAENNGQVVIQVAQSHATEGTYAITPNQPNLDFLDELTEEELVQLNLMLNGALTTDQTSTSTSSSSSSNANRNGQTNTPTPPTANANANSGNALQTLLPVFTQARGPRRYYSGFVSLESIWFILTNLALIITLGVESHKTCDGSHLKRWAVVQIILQFLMLLGNIVGSKLLPRESDSEEQAQRKAMVLAIFYVFGRLFNLFWLIWVICGIVWTLTSKSCSTQVPSLYYVCFVLAICHLILLGLPVLLCCCSIPVAILVYNFCPRAFGMKPPRSASKKTINKHTSVKKYKEGLMNKEDASCAICLMEYGVGDEVRFLRCGHHFHSECVVSWLVKNKSCPFCKIDIDEADVKDFKLKRKETGNPEEVQSLNENVNLDDNIIEMDEEEPEESLIPRKNQN